MQMSFQILSHILLWVFGGFKSFIGADFSQFRPSIQEVEPVTNHLDFSPLLSYSHMPFWKWSKKTVSLPVW